MFLRFQLLQKRYRPSQPRSTSPQVMCCLGSAVQNSPPPLQKKERNGCHITGKAPRQAPRTTLEVQLSLFSLRENSTMKKLVCTRGEQSQKEKSASKGTGRPVLCQGERGNSHRLSPHPAVSEVPSKQRSVRPWSRRVSDHRALPMLEI